MSVFPLMLLLGLACLEEPDQPVDEAQLRATPGQGPATGRPPLQDRQQPPPDAEEARQPAPEGAQGPQSGLPMRSPGPLQVALVPSSRSVLLYKAVVAHGERQPQVGAEGADQSGRSQGSASRLEVELSMPDGDDLTPLAGTREGFQQAVGTPEAPVHRSSAGFVRVQEALLNGEVDCGVLPGASVIQMLDNSEATSLALVLVAQLGSAGGDHSDLVVGVRKGLSTTVAPDVVRVGATSGLDARLLLSGLVPGSHQVLEDGEIDEALAAGTLDLVVAPVDLLYSALKAGTLVPFRPLTDPETAPSAQVLACRVSTLGSKEARESLKNLLGVYRGFLKRRGTEDPIALAGRYPKNARVNVETLQASLATLKSEELVGNAALEIVDLQALEEAGTPPDGPLSPSAVLVDNRMVAAAEGTGNRREGTKGKKGGAKQPPPPR